MLKAQGLCVAQCLCQPTHKPTDQPTNQLNHPPHTHTHNPPAAKYQSPEELARHAAAQALEDAARRRAEADDARNRALKEMMNANPAVTRGKQGGKNRLVRGAAAGGRGCRRGLVWSGLVWCLRGRVVGCSVVCGRVGIECVQAGWYHVWWCRGVRV
mgnify:CR=1 FL=1